MGIYCSLLDFFNIFDDRLVKKGPAFLSQMSGLGYKPRIVKYLPLSLWLSASLPETANHTAGWQARHTDGGQALQNNGG